jgi:hypothetical protein
MSQRGQPTNPNAQHTVVAFAPNAWQPAPQRPVSRTSSRATSTEPTITSAKSNGYTKHTNGKAKAPQREEEDFSDFGSDLDEMGDRRPPLHRPTDGRSHQPLLHKDDEERGRTGYTASPDLPDRPPLFTRRSTMRSRSPDTQAKLATKKKYTYAAFFLGLSLISFVVQTETAVYIQHELGWNKAYCML